MSLWHRHPGVRSGSDLSIGERAADSMRNGMGSWGFMGAATVFLAVWMVTGAFGFDKSPYFRLNLLLSCFAALQGAILLIAAKRADQVASEVALHTKANTDDLLAVNARQLDILTRLDGLSGQVTDLTGAIRDVLAAHLEHDSAVLTEVKAGRSAAESAFVATQALAATATAKPGLPEVVKAVSAQTDALRAMEQSVRTATGPQPVLTNPPKPAPAPGEPPPSVPELLAPPVAPPAPSGMGSRTPAAKPRGGKPA